MLKNNKQLLMYPPMMALAFYATLLGYAVPQLQAIFNLNYTQVGLFQTFQGAGMGAAVILCFCVFSAFNTIKISGIFMIFFALLMTLFGINKNIVVLYMLFFLIGLAQNTVDTLSNTVITETSSKNTSFYLGLMHGLWAFAGVLGPFLALAVGGSFEKAFILLGIFMALTAALFITGLWPVFRQPMIQNRRNLGGLVKLFRIMKVRGIAALAALNFFSCLVQNTYITFISAYVDDKFAFPLGKAIILSSLFLGLLIGRAIFSLTANKIKVLKTMAITNAIAVLCFAGMMLADNFVLLAVLMCLGSTMTALNFPALVLESHKIVPDDLSAASSIIYFGFFISILTAPALVGSIGDWLGLRNALLITSAGLIPITVIASVLSRHLDKQKTAS